MVTAAVLRLLHSHIVLHREADVAIVVVADTVCVANTTGVRAKAGESSHRGGEGEDNGGQGELHCDCVGSVLNESSYAPNV